MPRRKNGKNESGNSQVDWPFIVRLLGEEKIRTLLLHGPPGTGKTYACYTMGRIHNGVYAITLTEETPAAELRGTWMPRGNEFVWVDGPCTQAMREGARLVINEISHGSDDVLALLYAVLESAETARLTLPTNETVFPAPGFNVCATDNAGPEKLPGALRDRFDSIQEVDAPHPDALARLSEPLQRAAVQSFGLEPERAVSIRSWLKLEELREVLGLTDACRAVFGRERGSLIHDALVLAQGELKF